VIARISGKLIVKAPDHIVIDVHGIGYQIAIPLSTYYHLPDLNDDISIHTHTHVREDALLLFGFLTPGEKEAFELLIDVSKIGPKLALNILSNITVDELQKAIVQADVPKLYAIPGVGAKTAERIVLELKDKMKSIAHIHPSEMAEKVSDSASHLFQDAVLALVNLGYSKASAERALRQVISKAPQLYSTAELIKQSLRVLVDRESLLRT